MNLLTRDTDYAVRALIYINLAGRRLVSVTEINQRLALPRPFLRKILQQLVNGGVLISVKGNQGGFKLARSASKICLVDLMAIFQGSDNMVECIFIKQVCENKQTCPLRKELKDIERDALNKMRKITIAKLSQNH
ncbi:RrF2 family transcriptional regulator [Candidatus Omnitrophota bacterium]